MTSVDAAYALRADIAGARLTRKAAMKRADILQGPALNGYGLRNRDLPDRVLPNRVLVADAASDQVGWDRRRSSYRNRFEGTRRQVTASSLSNGVCADGMSALASSHGRTGARAGARTRLTLRGKIVIACIVAMLSWVGWSAVSAESAQSDEGTVQVVNYTVRPGDSLWSYATDITPAGEDVSERVNLIMKLNNLDSPELKPGQTLVVPAE